MKGSEIFERLKKKVTTRIQDFRQGRQSWRLKEWHHLQSLIYSVYGIATLIFVRLLANSNPDNSNYDHFVNDPSDSGTSLAFCGITPMFNFIPIPGSYILIIYSIYSLSIISLAISLLSFILGFSFMYFSRIPRSFFFSPSKRTKILGFCCKILPIIIRVLNLLFIFFLIIPFIYITTSGACYRRLVRFERNKVQNCRIWVSKCAKDHRVFGRHLECSLRKNFRHFPTEIVDPTIGENLDMSIGGPMPLLCPMCNEVRMDPKSPLYKGEAYVEQLKSSISKMEATSIKDRSLYRTEALSLIQLSSGTFRENYNRKADIEFEQAVKDWGHSNFKTAFQGIWKPAEYETIRFLPILVSFSLIQLGESSQDKDKKIGRKNDELVSLESPISLDLNSEYADYYDSRPTVRLPSKVNIPSMYKLILEKYKAAMSSQLSGDTLFNDEVIQARELSVEKGANKKNAVGGVERATLNNSFKSRFQFNGDSTITSLSVDQSIDLNKEFEAARYQIQVTMHEGSNFSRSIFVFMLISLVFWALTRFFSFVIFNATKNEACFYVPNSKRTLIWSKLRDFMDILS
ncbi:multi-pass transmembrane protein [Cryptosporidium felis]|nr:multi-pass transmembrane protein [Cryptosporidium felis]